MGGGVRPDLEPQGHGGVGDFTRQLPNFLLVRAVKTTAAGGKVLDPAIAAKVIAQMTAGRPAAADQIEPLSERELTVLRRAGQGLTNKAIGVELGISDRTVQGHLANIYGKLGVASRTEAVTTALKLGWIVLEGK